MEATAGEAHCPTLVQAPEQEKASLGLPFTGKSSCRDLVTTANIGDCLVAELQWWCFGTLVSAPHDGCETGPTFVTLTT